MVVSAIEAVAQGSIDYEFKDKKPLVIVLDTISDETDDIRLA